MKLSFNISIQDLIEKQKLGDIQCFGNKIICSQCPLNKFKFPCDMIHKTVKENVDHLYEVYPETKLMKRYFNKELNKEVEEI